MNAITIPLSAASVSGMTMMMSRNIMPSSKMDFVGCVTFSADGTYSGDMSGLWEAKGGQILLSDSWKKPMFAFCGAETRNGSTFLIGDTFLEAHVSGFVRSVLYEAKPLGDNFRICVSSHKDYAGETVPRLLRSLSRIAFPKERVLVVVGGSDECKSHSPEDWPHLHVTHNQDGYTAMVALASNMPDFDGYWLLLHDTMEATDDFATKIAAIDIGLNYDMISRYSEIGLYSSSFIRLLNSNHVFDNKAVKKESISAISRMSSELSGGENQHAATKDVYGTGTKRDVIYLKDFGLKKFRRVKGAGAKP